MYRFFYIPYFYTNRAKLSKSGRLLSYFAILTFPSIYFALLQSTSVSFINVLSLIFGAILIQNLYEVGYIQNDTETIKKEANPTLRLSQSELSYYELNSLTIYLSRVFIDIVLIVLLLSFNHASEEIWIFLCVAHLIIPFFLLYNAIRSKWNLLLHFVLAILKYSSLQFLFFKTMNADVFILSIFAYPFMNLIDRSATPRFMSKFSQYYIPRTAIFRTAYYFMFFVFCGLLWKTGKIDIYIPIIAAYYLLYRSFIACARIK